MSFKKKDTSTNTKKKKSKERADKKSTEHSYWKEKKEMVRLRETEVVPRLCIVFLLLLTSVLIGLDSQTKEIAYMHKRKSLSDICLLWSKSVFLYIIDYKDLHRYHHTI